MLVSEARKLCKGLVLVDGEDLTPFRDASKVLFNFLRSYSWNNKIERLGFDEVFMGERERERGRALRTFPSLNIDSR